MPDTLSEAFNTEQCSYFIFFPPLNEIAYPYLPFTLTNCLHPRRTVTPFCGTFVVYDQYFLVSRERRVINHLVFSVLSMHLLLFTPLLFPFFSLYPFIIISAFPSPPLLPHLPRHLLSCPLPLLAPLLDVIILCVCAFLCLYS